MQMKAKSTLQTKVNRTPQMEGKQTMRTHFNEKAWDRRQSWIYMASSGNLSSSSEDDG